MVGFLVAARAPLVNVFERGSEPFSASPIPPRPSTGGGFKTAMQQPISSPPTGRRASSPLHRDMAARAARFAGLPANVSPYDILRLIKRVGNDIGFTPVLVQHLEYLIGFTRPGDWEPGNRPVVYAQMTAQAIDLGITEEQVRVREGALHRLGALAWNDSGNHKRFGRRDPATGRIVEAFGVDLSPLAALYHPLQDAAETRDRDIAAWKAGRNRAHALRAAVRRLFDELRGRSRLEGRRLDLERAYGAAHRWDVRAGTPLATLEREVAALTLFKATLLDLLSGDDATETAPKPTGAADSTGETWTRDPKNTDHQYNTTTRLKSQRDTCNPEGDNQRRRPDGRHVGAGLEAAKAAARPQKAFQVGCGGDPGTPRKEPVPASGGGGRDDAASALYPCGMEHVDLRQCLNAAGPTFRAFLPDQPDEFASWEDFARAAAELRVPLGVSDPAWRGGVAAVGPRAAALCVMLSARESVYSPGGYFRRMIERAAAGELHLHKSIFGILRRERTNA